MDLTTEKLERFGRDRNRMRPVGGRNVKRLSKVIFKSILEKTMVTIRIPKRSTVFRPSHVFTELNYFWKDSFHLN